MTEDLPATFETIDSLQMQGDAETLCNILYYLIDAIRDVTEEDTCPGQRPQRCSWTRN